MANKQSKGRQRRAELIQAADQDRKSKKTPMKRNLTTPTEFVATLEERVRQNPELAWTQRQREMAGI
jgi:hypothetical protein